MLKQIALISNICLEPYWRMYIKDRLSCASDDVQTNFILYEAHQDHRDDLQSADMIIVCLNFNRFYPNLSNDVSAGRVTYEDIEKDCITRCKKLYAYIKAYNRSAHIIWFGFEDYDCLQSGNYGSVISFGGVIDRLNLALNDLLFEDSFVDFKRLIAAAGIDNAYDTKGKYRFNAPYSKKMICLMADEVYKQHTVYAGITKKCLVVDCDNVLWGGILSEDGICGIQIAESGFGRPFQDFQRYLLDLYYHGVILAVCSKNDEADVLRVFREHTGMLLKEEHIACFQCNWHHKPDNIKAIADLLNIGLESMVFVDDTVFEIESVRATLPAVKAVLYQRDSVYKELSCFNLNKNSDLGTIKERTNTYKTNAVRNELKKSAHSYDDYLSSLEMIVDIHKTGDDELARIAELTQRTNKCTNGIRYTLHQLKAMIGSVDYELYTVCLSDRFSDLGVVGAMGICQQTVDLFSLSCRALGRNIEHQMIDWLLKKNVALARYHSTTKNEALYSLFRSCGLDVEMSMMTILIP